MKKPGDIFKQITLIHLAICIATALIIGIIYTIKSKSGEVVSSEIGWDILEIIVPVTAVLTFAVAYYFGKSRYKKVQASDSLESKLDVYRLNNIVLWAALEGSAFFGGIAFYLSGRTNILLYSLMMGVLLIYFRPLKSRAIEDLKLSPE
ncbi:MAG: hypothetical protein ACPGYY_04685, partial [Bacteroidia bacterium]